MFPLIIIVFFLLYGSLTSPMSLVKDVSESSILQACLRGDLKYIQSLDNVNYNYSIDKETPLLNAISNYEDALKGEASMQNLAIELIMHLLKNGADIHRPDKSSVGRNLTPFHILAKKGYSAVLHAVIDYDQDCLSFASPYDNENPYFETRDFQGMNVLMLTLREYHIDLVIILLHAIPHKQLFRIINMQDNDGRTLFDWLYYFLSSIPNTKCAEIDKGIATHNSLCNLGYKLAALGANLPSLTTKCRQLGRVLHAIQSIFIAVKTGNVEQIRKNNILSAGDLAILDICDVNDLCDAEGNPLIYVALKHGRKIALLYVLCHCPRLITQKNRFGQNLFVFSREQSGGSIEMMVFLAKLAFQLNPVPSTQT